MLRLLQTKSSWTKPGRFLGLRMRTLITRRYALTCYIGQTYGELYDLQEDPNQLHNLWSDSGCRQTRLELQAYMMERFAETDNTLPRRMGHA